MNRLIAHQVKYTVNTPNKYKPSEFTTALMHSHLGKRPFSYTHINNMFEEVLENGDRLIAIRLRNLDKLPNQNYAQNFQTKNFVRISANEIADKVFLFHFYTENETDKIDVFEFFLYPTVQNLDDNRYRWEETSQFDENIFRYTITAAFESASGYKESIQYRMYSDFQYDIQKKKLSYDEPGIFCLEDIQSIPQVYSSFNDFHKLDFPSNLYSYAYQQSTIGRQSPYCCWNIEGIILPDTLNLFPENMFASFIGLTKVRLPKKISSIPPWLFADCDNLEAVEIPENITSIGSCAFYRCRNLRQFRIPETITSIGDHAFGSCSNLQQIHISESVSSIGEGAFSNCSALCDIRIPDKVKILSYDVFQNCKKLKRIVHSPDLQWTGGWLPIGQYGAESFTVEASIDHEDACAHLPKLKELSFGPSVYTISPRAFDKCEALETIRFSDSLTTIPVRAFANCSSLRELNIPSSVQTIESSAFEGCTSLTRVTIGNPDCKIKEDAFMNCHKISEFRFEGSNRKELLYAAKGFTLENNQLVEYLGCDEEITVPEGTVVIRNIVRYKRSKNETLTRMILPDSVTTIGREAFSNCKKLQYLYIPASVNKICGDIFKNGSPKVCITYAGNSADFKAMTKQEEHQVRYFQDDGWHHGRGYHVKYTEFIPVFRTGNPDFVCEVYCEQDGKKLIFHEEKPLDTKNKDSWYDGV